MAYILKLSSEELQEKMSNISSTHFIRQHTEKYSIGLNSFQIWNVLIH